MFRTAYNTFVKQIVEQPGSPTASILFLKYYIANNIDAYPRFIESGHGIA